MKNRSKKYNTEQKEKKTNEIELFGFKDNLNNNLIKNISLTLDTFFSFYPMIRYLLRMKMKKFSS